MQAIQLIETHGAPTQWQRPRLLVSVRNADEADVAVRAGAEWIDVKEPRHGSLGRADIETIRHVVQVVEARAPVSAALGELSDIAPSLAARIAGTPGLCLVKVGLAGVAEMPDWTDHWFRILDAAGEFASVAAVAYADWQSAGAPPPHTIVDQATRRCRALLVDTFDKSGPTLPELMTRAQLTRLLSAARSGGMATVVAGRLTPASLADVLPAVPDLIAVRGAVCRRGRTESLSAELVRELRERLETLARIIHKDRRERFSSVSS